MAGIYTDVLASEIAENIFPDSSFVVHSKDDTIWVNNENVRLPQSGAIPATQRNRSVFPATITERTDTVIEYMLQEFSSDPSRVRNMDAVKVSYNKRKDVLSDHSMSLQQDLANYLAYVWAANTAAGILVTTGGLRQSSAVGSTGNRKGLTLKDVQNAMVKLDVQDIPRDGRKILLNPNMLSDLLDDSKLTSRDWTNNSNSLQNGTVGRLMGFDVYVRSSVISYADNSVTPKDPIALRATNDDAGALVWHPSFVRRALGATKVYLNPDQAAHYGDIMSAEVRGGGTAAYANRRGIVTIKEAK